MTCFSLLFGHCSLNLASSSFVLYHLFLPSRREMLGARLCPLRTRNCGSPLFSARCPDRDGPRRRHARQPRCKQEGRGKRSFLGPWEEEERTTALRVSCLLRDRVYIVKEKSRISKCSIFYLWRTLANLWSLFLCVSLSLVFLVLSVTPHTANRFLPLNRSAVFVWPIFA